jgi:subtilisin-like proprotein convertase family protein
LTPVPSSHRLFTTSTYLVVLDDSFRPEQSLTAFDGKNARGTWQLWVDDLATFDTGRINSWSVTSQG